MSTEIKFEALTQTELEWCAGMRNASLDLVKAYTGSRPKGPPTIREIHNTYEGWLVATKPSGLFRKSPKGHPDANQVSMTLGVVLGDQIAKNTGMQWGIVTDSFGTDLALYLGGQPGKWSDIVTHPMNFVAKRIVNRESGWLETASGKLINEIISVTGSHA